MDGATIDAMVEVNERFAGLLAGRTDLPVPDLGIREDYWDPRAVALLREHGPRARRLLDLIGEIGDSAPLRIEGNDVLHPDLTFGNILYESGRVTGVVDWNWGLERGDRRFALVRIYIDLYWSLVYPGNVEPSAWERLDAVVEDVIEPDLLRAYWANVTLGQLSHWIIEGSATAVDLFLRLGESRLTPEPETKPKPTPLTGHSSRRFCGVSLRK